MAIILQEASICLGLSLSGLLLVADFEVSEMGSHRLLQIGGSSSSRLIYGRRRTGVALAAIPTLARKTIESVTVVVTTPVASMLITIRTAIDRCAAKRSDYSDCRNIDPYGPIRMGLGRNAGTHTCNCESCAHCN